MTSLFTINTRRTGCSFGNDLSFFTSSIYLTYMKINFSDVKLLITTTKIQSMSQWNNHAILSSRLWQSSKHQFPDSKSWQGIFYLSNSVFRIISYNHDKRFKSSSWQEVLSLRVENNPHSSVRSHGAVLSTRDTLRCHAKFYWHTESRWAWRIHTSKSQALVFNRHAFPHLQLELMSGK